MFSPTIMLLAGGLTATREQDKYQSDGGRASVEHGRLNGPNSPYAHVLLRQHVDY